MSLVGTVVSAVEIFMVCDIGFLGQNVQKGLGFRV